MLKLKLQRFGHLMQRANSLQKTLMLGKMEGSRRGRHHRLNAHEFEQAPGDEGCAAIHGVASNPWGCKESDTTEWLNNIKNTIIFRDLFFSL